MPVPQKNKDLNYKNSLAAVQVKLQPVTRLVYSLKWKYIRAPFCLGLVKMLTMKCNVSGLSPTGDLCCISLALTSYQLSTGSI